MAAPYPPQGDQRQYTERPLKIFGEQYIEGGPLPIGATTNFGDPPIFVDGLPRVALPTGWVLVTVTDWVISNRYSGKPIDVLSADEFAERFGGGGGPA
jgi:hypothetical protein